MTDTTEYETILVDRPAPRVARVTLNRPKALNALNLQLMHELVGVVVALDKDPEIGAVVITGSERAFAAGADIKAMQSLDYPQTYTEDLFADWDRLANLRTPTIAAVSGYALGGGCELAMLCDFIIAAENAVFGQPEIKLGVIPGIGGSQRLTRAVGKAKAMDLVLTGRTMDVTEAERAGLVARVVPTENLQDEAVAAAATIASYSAPVVALAKDAVDRSFETTLAEGVRFERRVFHSLFALADQKEGMAAFAEKRPASFQHR